MKPTMTNPLHPTEFHDDDLLYSKQFEDHYYSRNDGRAECEHVFLAGNGLPDRWMSSKQFTIGELGFGTGLNFLATWELWKATRKPGQHLSFVSVEGFPVSRETAARALARWSQLETLSASLLEGWGDLGGLTKLDEQTSLHVHLGEADHKIGNFSMVDAWFLDGFAPSKNTSMWSAELMQQVFDHTNPGGSCATYTAAGWVRRNLSDAGFVVEKRQGFGTKRDMSVAQKPALLP